jgi:hypothetical protein
MIQTQAQFFFTHLPQEGPLIKIKFYPLTRHKGGGEYNIYIKKLNPPHIWCEGGRATILVKRN